MYKYCLLPKLIVKYNLIHLQNLSQFKLKYDYSKTLPVKILCPNK